MSLSNKLSAEFLGTAWLVFGGCGSAVIAAAFPGVGIGLLGVSLAFGLTVLTMAYAIGQDPSFDGEIVIRFTFNLVTGYKNKTNLNPMTTGKHEK